MALWENADLLDLLIDDALATLGDKFGPAVRRQATSQAVYEEIIALCEAYDVASEGDVWYAVADALRDRARLSRQEQGAGRHREVVSAEVFA
jgi:hypothetical protein